MARIWLVRLGEHELARIVMHDSRVMFHRTNKAFFIGYFLSFVQPGISHLNLLGYATMPFNSTIISKSSSNIMIV
jgi:hypothetical protein